MSATTYLIFLIKPGFFERLFQYSFSQLVSNNESNLSFSKFARDLFNNDIFLTLVLTDTKIIDNNNLVLAESYFKKRGGFKPGFMSNIIKNKYLGCTMAFNPNMKKLILPFPDKIPSHDMWIGLINSIYGKINFIDIPLMGYRRHGKNVSPISHQSIWKMLIWRLNFIYRLSQRIVKVLFKKI